MWCVSPFPQVCTLTARAITLQGGTRCHWHNWQGTVSYMRSNITLFQDHFLLKIPVFFCNQLSGFANPQNRTFSHRFLCIRVWPQRIKAMCWTSPSRYDRFCCSKPWLAISLIGSTLTPPLDTEGKMAHNSLAKWTQEKCRMKVVSGIQSYFWTPFFHIFFNF